MRARARAEHGFTEMIFEGEVIETDDLDACGEVVYRREEREMCLEGCFLLIVEMWCIVGACVIADVVRVIVVGIGMRGHGGEQKSKRWMKRLWPAEADEVDPQRILQLNLIPAKIAITWTVCNP